MIKIPYKSYKFLNKLNKFDVFQIKPNNLGCIKILIDKGLVKQHQSLTLNNLLKNSDSNRYLTITTDGIIYLSSYKSDRLRYIVPLIVSIIALIISIASVLMQVL